ncbi:hypothetical protein [Sulfurimonas sp.]
MLKLLLVLFFSFGFINAAEMGKNGGGCVLSQKGIVKVYFKQNFINDVKYTPNAPSGKNFREIFIGSVIDAKNLKIKIIDYKPNKRMKGKPKTGVFFVQASTNSITKTISMTYIFDDGIITATGVLDKSSIGFETNVKYELCNVSIK